MKALIQNMRNVCVCVTASKHNTSQYHFRRVTGLQWVDVQITSQQLTLGSHTPSATVLQ